MGGESHQRSQEGRDRQRRGHDQGRELRANPAAGRAEADAECGVRPHDVEQHDRGHRVSNAARSRIGAAGQRHVIGHVQQTDRRCPARTDLRGRSEEHGARGRHRGDHP